MEQRLEKDSRRLCQLRAPLSVSAVAKADTSVPLPLREELAVRPVDYTAHWRIGDLAHFTALQQQWLAEADR